MEHVWACGKTLHGQDTPEKTTAWVKEQEAALAVEGDSINSCCKN